MDQKSAKEIKMSESKIPKTNSSEWKKNEKIINENPALKRTRDISQGLEKKHYGSTHGGKGSASRTNTNSVEYQDNFDKIFKQGKYKVSNKDD